MGKRGGFFNNLLKLLKAGMEGGKEQEKEQIKRGAPSKAIKLKEVEAGSLSKSKSKTIGESDVKWEVRKDEYRDSVHIYRDGKEWFYVSERWVSNSGEYEFFDGFFGEESEGYALLQDGKGVKRARLNDSIVDAVMCDDGIAYALTEGGRFYTITKDSTVSQLLMDYMDNWLLTEVYCVVAEDTREQIKIKILYIKEGKIKTGTVKKPRGCEQQAETKMRIAGRTLEISFPDGSRSTIAL